MENYLIIQSFNKHANSQIYIDQNKAMGANVLDADYIREDVISAYRVQYLDACGATKAIKANVNDVKTILDKAGLNESAKNAQKFVDGINSKSKE